MRIKSLFRAAALAVLLSPATALALDVADNLSVTRITASANQLTGFTIPWGFYEADDLVVKTSPDAGVTWTTKTLTTDYTVTGANGSSGSLTFLSGRCDGTSAGCDSGTLVVIYRLSSPRTVAAFGSSISSAALNLTFEKLTAWVQELQQQITDLALRVPVTDDVDMALPSVSTAVAGNAPILNATKDGWEWSDVDLTDAGTVTSVAASGSEGISVSGSPVTTSGTLTFSVGDLTPDSVVIGNRGGMYLAESIGNGVHSVGHKAPASLAASYTLDWPADDGTAGQVLSTTDGTGTLDFVDLLAALEDTCDGTDNQILKWETNGDVSCVTFGGAVVGSPTALALAADFSELDDALEGTFTYDPANLVDGAGETKTFTCTGAALGDVVSVGPGVDVVGLNFSASVTSADNCAVRLQNESGITADLASSTWGYAVIR